MALFAHQKQYLIGPLPVFIRLDLLAVEMGQDLILSHCPKLRVQALRSKDGIACWLLGLPIPADDATTSIADVFHLRTITEIEDWTGFWAGKWLLVCAQRCWQDASGCLGVHWRRINRDIWISSSPALLGAHLPAAPESARLPWRVFHGKGLDWIPAPFTTRADVYKVPPLRTVDPRDGSTRPVHFIGAGPAASGIGTFAATLKAIMTNWERAEFRERYVALTAGLDTRTVLAAAAAAGIDFRTFTTHLPYTPECDRTLPPRIATRIGAPHELRQLTPVSPADAERRAAAIAEHMDGATFHPGSQYRMRFNDGFVGDGDRVVAHGACFELGRCFYWSKFSKRGVVAPPTDPDQILSAFTFRSTWRPEPSALWQQALRTWIESQSEPLPLALDWRDRFYLEQRLAGWASNTQRLSDLFESTFFYPANCLRIFELLLQFEPQERAEGFAQKSVIALLAPRLREIPINPESISEKFKAAVRKVVRRKGVGGLRFNIRR